MSKAVYPGSFDPFSNGHLDIVRRASSIFEEVHVVVSINVKKKPTFTPRERVLMIQNVCREFKNVKVVASELLVVEYAKRNNLNVIIRGLRNYQDYESEFSLSQFNRDIEPSIETVLFMPTAKNQFITSSSIKELLLFNVDISPYVPKEIADEIRLKFKK